MSADDETKGDPPKPSEASEGERSAKAAARSEPAEDAAASDTVVSDTRPSDTPSSLAKRAIDEATANAIDGARARATKGLKRWRIVAIVSLSLNVFILGIAAGGAILRPRLPGPGGMGGPGRAPPFTVRGAEVALGERVRDRVMGLEQAHKKAIDDALEQLRVRAEEVDAVLLVDPLDQPKLDAALAALRKANDAFQAELHLEFRDLVMGLSLEERRRLSEAGKRLGPGKRQKRQRP